MSVGLGPSGPFRSSGADACLLTHHNEGFGRNKVFIKVARPDIKSLKRFL